MTMIFDTNVTYVTSVTPMTSVTHKGAHLYLAADTLAVLKARNIAKGAAYRNLRNRGNALVKRDKLRSNMMCLAKHSGDSRVLWAMANSALGKNRPSLPSTISKADGSMTAGNTEAATVMSDYYITKVDLLRERNVG